MQWYPIQLYASIYSVIYQMCVFVEEAILKNISIYV